MLRPGSGSVAKRKAPEAAQLLAEDCPEIERHTSHPTTYEAHHYWADKMARTHDQQQCPACGFWCVWVPREGVSG